MATDWGKPTTTSAYADFVTELDARLDDLAKGMDVADGTSLPANTIKWDSASSMWKKWSGTAWGSLSATYAIDITGNAATATKWASGQTLTITGDVSTPSPPTVDGSGAISVSVTLGTVAATKGGTGQTGYAIGDLLYANTTTTMGKLAGVATGNALISGGVGSPPAWGKVGLTTHISGTLGPTNGGTNQTTWALGDIMYGSGVNTLAKLSGNTTTTKKFLRQTGTGSAAAAPAWDTLVDGDLPAAMDGKTLTTVSITSSSVMTLPPGSGSTTTGRMQWGSDLLKIGNAAGTGVKTMVDTDSTQTLIGKTLTSPVLTTPNIGVPSAGTLTYCTGLPKGGVTFAATDTLLGRATAGAGVGEEIACTAFGRSLIDDADNIAALATLGSGSTQTAWIPAAAMTARTTSGAAAGTTESTTNKVMLKTLDFDAATDEFAQFAIRMPNGWNEGTVTARFVWMAAATGDVVWGMQTLALSNDEVVDSAFGTATTVTDGVTATTDLMESGACSVAVGATVGDWVVFQVYRDADNVSDTCTVDAKLLGISLTYLTASLDDA